MLEGILYSKNEAIKPSIKPTNIAALSTTSESPKCKAIASSKMAISAAVLFPKPTNPARKTIVFTAATATW